MTSLKMALRSIGANKLRAVLTMLGIIIGVIALVVLDLFFSYEICDLCFIIRDKSLIAKTLDHGIDGRLLPAVHLLADVGKFTGRDRRILPDQLHQSIFTVTDRIVFHGHSPFIIQDHSTRVELHCQLKFYDCRTDRT